MEKTVTKTARGYDDKMPADKAFHDKASLDNIFDKLPADKTFSQARAPAVEAHALLLLLLLLPLLLKMARHLRALAVPNVEAASCSASGTWNSPGPRAL